MIDYLELLFLPKEAKQTGGEEIPARSGQKVEHEPVEFRTVSLPEGEEPKEASTKAAGDVEVLDPGRVRLGSEPVAETGEGFSLSVSRMREQPNGVEELERRLRRDSRRYDSGFYRY